MPLFLNTKTLTIEVQHSASENYTPSPEAVEIVEQCANVKKAYLTKKAEIDAIFKEYVDTNILPELQIIADKIKDINKIK